MFSEMIREALEREIVGQPDAVNSVARGVTRLASSLTPAERSWAAYMLVGPAGTGRGHLVRSAARVLYGHENVLTIHGLSVGHVDPWTDFLRRLEPLLSPQPRPVAPSAAGSAHPDGPLHADRAGAPLRLVLVKDLERANKHILPQLAYLLGSGQEVLPDGRCLRLDGTIFFFTSAVCSSQILDHTRLGFSGSSPESGQNGRGNLLEICREEAQSSFGVDLVGQLDDLIVFQRLSAEHLAEVLDRYFARLNRYLEARRITGTLSPAARAHLLALAGGERSTGAQDLVRVHRDEVEFPIADLLISGALVPGGGVDLDHHEGDAHLHFAVRAPRDEVRTREVPIGV